MAHLTITVPLVGEQLSLIPGDTIATRAGTATVTRLEPVGREQVIWADYGSGIEQPNTAEGLLSLEQFKVGDRIQTCGSRPRIGVIEALNQQGLSIRWENDRLSSLTWRDYQHYGYQRLASPEQLTPTQHPKRKRRHSPKGQACGWIEERQGNLKRKNPSTSYYYCWQEGDRRGKQYVPVRKMAQVQQMINDRCSVGDILAYLSKDPNARMHHTFTPKI